MAALLGLDHVDTDALVVGAWGSIPEIFRSHGEEHFRTLERHAVVDALARSAVVSLGGGAVTHPDTRRDLTRHPVVLLRITPEAVSTRLDNDKRPLLTDGLASWEKLVSSRMPLYEEVATWSVDVSHRSTEEVAQEIVSWVEHRGAGND